MGERIGPSSSVFSLQRPDTSISATMRLFVGCAKIEPDNFSSGVRRAVSQRNMTYGQDFGRNLLQLVS